MTFGVGLGVEGGPDGLGPLGKDPEGGTTLVPDGSPGYEPYKSDGLGPPLGAPPLGDPPLGEPPFGNPPFGNPPLGNPPAGDPPLTEDDENE